LSEEADGFGTVLGVVVEGGVEATELLLWDERKDGPRNRARFLAPVGLRRTLRSSRQRVASLRQWFLFSTDQCSRPIWASLAWLTTPSSRLKIKLQHKLQQTQIINNVLA
jgi:hypothetical protein